MEAPAAEPYLSPAVRRRLRGIGAALENLRSDIAEAAVRALQANYAVPDERIKLTVRQGWITMEGTVEWQHQRAAAESSIRHLIGVKGVSD